MLGIVVPNTTNSFYATFAHQVQLAAADRGYALLVANSNDSAALEKRHLHHFATRGVDGVMLTSASTHPDLDALRRTGTPVVLLNHFTATTEAASVNADLFHGTHLAMAHLAQHGYREVGLIIGQIDDARLAGWRDAITTLDLDPGPVIQSSYSHQGGYQAGRDLIASGELPRALFASSDQQAIGLLLALHEAGVRVPDEVALVGFDGTHDGAYTWPPLTSVAQPVEEMARAAVDALIDGLPSEMRRLCTPTLTIRRSCGCEPEAGATSPPVPARTAPR